MTTVHAPDFVPFSELPLLRSLTTQERRPNLLVVCAGTPLDAVVERFGALCVTPFKPCVLPGPLVLPREGSGTLLLHEVAALTLAQQLALFDWMTERQSDVQVISVTGSPLLSHVQDGRFLEGLFYRLNTICVLATGDAGEWQHPDPSASRRGRRFKAS